MLHIENKTIALLIVAGAFILVLFSFWAPPEGQNSKSLAQDVTDVPKGSAIGSADSMAVQKSTRSVTENGGATRTSRLSPRPDKIIKELKELEFGRTTFCRELKDYRGDTLREFIIDSPSQDEREKILDLLNQVESVTLDDKGEEVAWSVKLREEFLWPDHIRYLHLTTDRSEQTGKGHFTMMGIADGNLDMRGGDAPMPADGGIHLLAPEVTFEYDKVWRFSHLFTAEE